MITTTVTQIIHSVNQSQYQPYQTTIVITKNSNYRSKILREVFVEKKQRE